MRAFTVTILQPEVKIFSCRPDQTLLDGALQSGITVPYGCGAGKCTRCRCRVVQGEFIRLNTPVNAKFARGDIVFVCCTRPLTDMLISYSDTQPYTGPSL
ncbi:MAG: 2Fe-2S iron-sulfur cluster binding domain-containing protein [Ramlibacter sp.]|nr:2Fe-2S iron-sulfur cluster binding domain-containing protein [Ramlibacter sp.]